jgi:outer membrane lipoprotein-sorting protein
MRLGKKIIVAVALALLLVPGCSLLAADGKDVILRQLDAAAARFHNTTADFQFDTVQTDPIPDTTTQKGTAYYERVGKAFRMAAHIREEDGKPAPKIYAYADGTVRLFEQNVNQVTTLSKLSQYESWFMLGFGASGKDLEEKWEIKDLGSDTLVDGTTSFKTEKLELVPKDPAVRKNIPKVQIWLDMDLAISRKQVIYEGSGQYRVCVYYNVRANQKKLPDDAFKFATDKQTAYVNR